jgi:hypothetical protein
LEIPYVPERYSFRTSTACVVFKNDFGRFKALPDYWWYYLDQHGEGKALDFPIKIKPVVSWSPIQYIVKSGKFVKASRFPVEKLCITIAKRACNIDNIDNL